MKLECKINGTQHTIMTNADKPLSLILNETVPGFETSNSCLGGKCGNCLIIMNDNIVMSCLVPAFKAMNADILTFSGFSKTRSYKDIEKAYAEAGNKPCRQCYASKTLLIESILRKIEKSKLLDGAFDPMRQSFYAARHQKMKRDPIIKAADLMKNINVNACRCMEIPELENIVRIAQRIRIRSRMNNAGKP